MPPKVEGLEQLLVEELQDMYDAEKQLVRALPKMAKAAGDGELQNALRNHLEVTRGQVQRLEQVFEAMDMRARSRPCRGMRGIVEEGEEMVRQEREEALLDSGIAGSARKVEHYEIAGYESVRSLAQQLGMRGAAQLLEQTLREEIEADKQLAQISKRLVKEAASAGSMTAREEEAGSRGGRAGGRRRSVSSRASSRSAGKSRAARGGSGRATGGHTAHPLVDHEEIRQWAEERGAQPSCVRGTGGRGDTGMIRLNFPGYSGEESLQDIDWDEWFQKFDDNGLALMVQEATARGQKSNFNKLVKREHAEKPRARSAH
ncbi:MAG TPA: ferritin-like domain-containing protein [Bryobacteraceae bacterium]|nr:ferritin-like domain-containing protein [Bryobacteraceae bacterium]